MVLRYNLEMKLRGVGKEKKSEHSRRGMKSGKGECVPVLPEAMGSEAIAP